MGCSSGEVPLTKHDYHCQLNKFKTTLLLLKKKNRSEEKRLKIKRKLSLAIDKIKMNLLNFLEPSAIRHCFLSSDFYTFTSTAIVDS